MSKILRRPMFRGGRANSDGVGITSGLNRPGYANGPGPVNVTYNVAPGKTSVSGADLLNKAMGKPGTFIGDTNRLLTNINEGIYNYGVRPLGNLGILGSNYLLGTDIEPIKERDYQQELLDRIYASKYGPKTGSAQAKEIAPQEEGITDYSYTEQEREDQKRASQTLEKELEKQQKQNEKNESGTEDGNEFRGKGDSDSISLSDAEKAKKEYADLLGLEKARMQDAYDMLIRFGAAKGKDFREVAQDFLASEAKAGPSRTEKIKEAAGTLAVKEAIENKQLDKKIAAALAKGEGSTDFTRMVKMLKDPNLDRRTKSIIIAKMGWQPSLESQINKLKQEGSVTSTTIDEIAGIYIPNYRGILTPSVKADGVYLDTTGKKLVTLQGGQVTGAQPIKY
jgi:hypothetical protein